MTVALLLLFGALVIVVALVVTYVVRAHQRVGVAPAPEADEHDQLDEPDEPDEPDESDEAVEWPADDPEGKLVVYGYRGLSDH